MSDASGLGFGSVLWGKSILSSNSGEFCPLYQGRSPNFQEGKNLTTKIDQSVASGELHDVELFVFTKNMVFRAYITKGRRRVLCCLRLSYGYIRLKQRGI